MKILGKIVGAVVGFVITRNGWGLLAGLFLGHLWDLGVLRPRPPVRSASFLNPLFAFAGAVSKSDGRVSEAEIQAAEALMTRMQLDGEQRRAAIDSFNRGKQSQFDTQPAIAELRAWAGGRRDLGFLLLDMLLDIVHADGALSNEKLSLIGRLAGALGISDNEFSALSAMKGYGRRGTGPGAQPGGGRSARPQPGRPDPYAILGLARGASDRDIKTAWRRLMSQHHPDKLGDVPDELKRRAEQRAREINAAYEQIKNERGH
ncbi:MAG TPA: co-chaperone DjlA [Dokdonella sp.]|uniref:co-chaperone DjlA n=1 Tax=Dokdonella sp. TaxID=2291710 RepID=UPI002C506CEF|nr:co-chaperone DjlA [Dokdonella sp.]HUD43392.1 co-chaperone DjlA [Dokdonella sp.]